MEDSLRNTGLWCYPEVYYLLTFSHQKPSKRKRLLLPNVNIMEFFKNVSFQPFTPFFRKDEKYPCFRLRLKEGAGCESALLLLLLVGVLILYYH